jgi:paraquat-inducible protein B
MSKKASPTVIGIFTLIGLILAGVAAVLFGAGKYFESTYPILLHFDKSAYGLQVGSSVRFGGVRIGSVRSISVLVDPEGNRKVIPVIVDLREKDLRLIGSEAGGGIDLTTREGVEKAVASGLCAGMKQESLVTGQLYIEFDILPDAERFVYKPGRPSEYPVVPTVGTQIDELVARHRRRDEGTARRPGRREGPDRQPQHEGDQRQPRRDHRGCPRSNR